MPEVGGVLHDLRGDTFYIADSIRLQNWVPDIGHSPQLASGPIAVFDDKAVIAPFKFNVIKLTFASSQKHHHDPINPVAMGGTGNASTNIEVLWPPSLRMML